MTCAVQGPNNKRKPKRDKEQTPNTRLSAGRGGWGAPIETTQSLLLDLVTRPIVQICIYGNNGMLTRRRLGRLCARSRDSMKDRVIRFRPDCNRGLLSLTHRFIGTPGLRPGLLPIMDSRWVLWLQF